MKYEYMAKLLNIYREENNLTQSKLAKRLGYTTSQYISNIERGLCSFPIKKFPKLAKVLKIDASLIADAYVNDVIAEVNRVLKGA